jgi:hypothetical protein
MYHSKLMDLLFENENNFYKAFAGAKKIYDLYALVLLQKFCKNCSHPENLQLQTLIHLFADLQMLQLRDRYLKYGRAP